MTKAFLSLLAGLTLVACSPSPSAYQTRYQGLRGASVEEWVKSQDMPLSERWMQEPELGDCGAPDQINGGKLVRMDDGLIYLGWWSHCEEGNFTMLPLVQYDDYPTNQIFRIETGPAHLKCSRMSEDMLEGHPELYAMYACASTYKLFKLLEYYEVPKVMPKPEPKKVPGKSI